MNRVSLSVVAVALAFGPIVVSAQELSRYRVYVLESSVAAVVAASGARAADTRTLQERPSKIQELQWRTPYAARGSALADPVSGIMFTFSNDALYQIVVSYDRDRTEGLMDNDVIGTLSASYGTPVLKSSITRPAMAYPDAMVIAQWDSPESSVTLLRNSFSEEFQLVLLSKALNTRARNAIREAARLDALDAPRREREQRKSDAADAVVAREKIRTTNKAAFRP